MRKGCSCSCLSGEGPVTAVPAASAKLLFVVNSERHREQGLQYDYTGARRLEDNYWELPVIGRRYLFYTPELARELLGSGWKIHDLTERPFRQWEIEKRVVTCLSERVDEDA